MSQPLLSKFKSVAVDQHIKPENKILPDHNSSFSKLITLRPSKNALTNFVSTPGVPLAKDSVKLKDSLQGTSEKTIKIEKAALHEQ